MRIDAHHHLWDPARGDYGWMPVDDPVLGQVYAPADLAPQLQAAGVAATVLVQAAPTVAETDYMLDLAAETPWIAGVVGWIDFEDPAQAKVLDRLAANPKLKGIRPMIQDIPDNDWMLSDGVQWAFSALIERELAFDCLGFPRHLENFHTLLARYPGLRAVVDHCMKPAIAEPSAFDDWAWGMQKIAEDSNAFCKLSGLVTEAGPDWTVDALQPYVDHVLTVFGANRVMWGSDWPVSRLRCEYGEWLAAAEALTAGLSEAECALVFGGTAQEFYRLEV